MIVATPLGQEVTAQEASVEIKARGFYPLPVTPPPPVSPSFYELQPPTLQPPVSPSVVPVSPYMPPITPVAPPPIYVPDVPDLPISHPIRRDPIVPLSPTWIEPPIVRIEPMPPASPAAVEPVTPLSPGMPPEDFRPVEPVLLVPVSPVRVPITPEAPYSPYALPPVSPAAVEPVPDIPAIPKVPIQIQPAPELPMIPDLPDIIREKELPQEVEPVLSRELPEMQPEPPLDMREPIFPVSPYPIQRPLPAPVSPVYEEEVFIPIEEKKPSALIWIGLAALVLILGAGEKPKKAKGASYESNSR